jgi:hypothetical protein
MQEYETQMGIEPQRIYVDKGYRGHGYPKKFRIIYTGCWVTA